MIGKVTLLAVLVLLAPSGCKKKEQPRDETLQAVVLAEGRIAKEEDEALARRGALQRERGILRDKREELATRKMILDDEDTQGRQAIEKEESELASSEAELIKQELGLNQKLQALIDEKSGLVGKLAREAGGQQALVTRREFSVALREKDLGRREAELARREKTLATREQAFTERQARMCPRTTTVVQTVAAPAVRAEAGGAYTRKEVEPVYRAALGAMQSKGIMTADLPTGIDRLVTEVRHSVGKGDYTRAKYAADQLLATVRSMKIDRGFIGAKIGRLNATIRRSPPKGDKLTRVNGLFQQATAAYGDGRFMEANRLLNRIYGLMQ